MINLIAAVSKNNVIGKNGSIPWHIPEDMRRFKYLTEGKIILMGRKTYESLPDGALPNRINMVLTTNKAYKAKEEETIIVHSIDEALEYYASSRNGNYSVVTDEGSLEGSLDAVVKLFVIGGEEIYKAFLPHADAIHITQVAVEVELGDAFFPEFDTADWYLTGEDKGVYCHKVGIDYTFVTYSTF